MERGRRQMGWVEVDWLNFLNCAPMRVTGGAEPPSSEAMWGSHGSTLGLIGS